MNRPGMAFTIASPVSENCPRMKDRSDSPHGLVYGKRRNVNVSQR